MWYTVTTVHLNRLRHLLFVNLNSQFYLRWQCARPPIFLSLPHPDMTIWHSCSQWFINRWLVEITEKFNFLVSVKSFPIVSFYLYRKVDITTEATVKPSCDHEAKPRKSKTFDLNILQLLNLHQALPTCGLLMYKKNKPLT